MQGDTLNIVRDMEKEDRWPHSTRREKGSMNAELGCIVKGLTLESSALQNSHVWFCRFGYILLCIDLSGVPVHAGCQSSLDGWHNKDWQSFNGQESTRRLHHD